MNKPPASGTWIEIDRNALARNLSELQRMLGDTRLCMVVKGNAYGHGYGAVVPLAEAAGVRHFAVFSAREAAGFLAASDGESRLMVMGHADHRNIPWLLENDVEVWLNDPHDWPLVRKAVRDADKPMRLHVEVETGMNRTGLQEEEAFRVAQEVAEHPGAVLEGVCTHLAGAEDQRNHARIEVQKQRYHANLRHIASSSAAMLQPDARLDLARVGIACYGLWPTREVRQSMQGRPDAPALCNVLTWKSRVVAVKHVPDGEYVGYGTTYEAEGDTLIAVVAVGYGDGFARDLSNRGHVLIRGKRATIVGNVNMNMVQCHVTHIPDVQAGDEVVLIGRQGSHDISVHSFSDFNMIVNYELMARLSWEIPRRVVDGPGIEFGGPPIP
jgi:alanine racemase